MSLEIADVSSLERDTRIGDDGVIRIEREHRFAIPVEAGFAFITDIANWHAYWPGFVRVEPGSRWRAPGDEARIVVRLLGRKVELRMTLGRFDVNRFVEYETTQNGAPDAHHERHFAPAGGGFLYRIVVEYEPGVGYEAFTTGSYYGVGRARTATDGREPRRQAVVLTTSLEQLGSPTH